MADAFRDTVLAMLIGNTNAERAIAAEEVAGLCDNLIACWSSADSSYDIVLEIVIRNTNAEGATTDEELALLLVSGNNNKSAV